MRTQSWAGIMYATEPPFSLRAKDSRKLKKGRKALIRRWVTWKKKTEVLPPQREGREGTGGRRNFPKQLRRGPLITILNKI